MSSLPYEYIFRTVWNCMDVISWQKCWHKLETNMRFFLPGDGFTSNYLPKQSHVQEHVSGKMSKVKRTSENDRGINEKQVKMARQRWPKGRPGHALSLIRTVMTTVRSDHVDVGMPVRDRTHPERLSTAMLPRVCTCHYSWRTGSAHSPWNCHPSILAPSSSTISILWS